PMRKNSTSNSSGQGIRKNEPASTVSSFREPALFTRCGRRINTWFRELRSPKTGSKSSVLIPLTPDLRRVYGERLTRRGIYFSTGLTSKQKPPSPNMPRIFWPITLVTLLISGLLILGGVLSVRGRLIKPEPDYIKRMESPSDSPQIF